MNEIDVLKKLRDDVPAPTPLVLAQARQKLQEPPRRRYLTRPRLLVAAALAATLTGGLLVNDVVTHDGQPAPGTVADANSFLAEAAGRIAADAPIPPGQFRQITLHASATQTIDEARKHRVTTLGQIDWWIPSTQRPPYTVKVNWHLKVDFANPAAEAYARKQSPNLFRPSTSINKNVCSVDTSGGSLRMMADPKKPCNADWYVPTPEFLARQPRDPDALLASLRSPDVDSDPSHKFQMIAATMSSGIAPADLRAALYQAARKIPGIQLLNDAVNLDGKRGRAIALEADGFRQELIIDPATGEFIGQRLIATGTAPKDGKPDPGLRKGDVISWTSVTTRITPTAPR